MNIEFSWKHDADGYSPVSKSNLVNHDGVSLLDCVLMDSGGLPYLETIPWLNEGVKRIQSVAVGKCDAADWSRETWGVELREGEAKIYSLYDEAYSQVLSLDVFARILQEWMAFLQSRPDSERVETYSI